MGVYQPLHTGTDYSYLGFKTWKIFFFFSSVNHLQQFGEDPRNLERRHYPDEMVNSQA